MASLMSQNQKTNPAINPKTKTIPKKVRKAKTTKSREKMSNPPSPSQPIPMSQRNHRMAISTESPGNQSRNNHRMAIQGNPAVNPWSQKIPRLAIPQARHASCSVPCPMKPKSARF
jgi:hypothetical protein